MLTSYSFGILSENLASLFLIIKGYKILHKRYKSYVGEIDIIASKNNAIIFIEVKSRKNLNFNYEIITKKQIYRIKRTASLYMANDKYYNKDIGVRFDLIMISNFIKINHIKNAW